VLAWRVKIEIRYQVLVLQAIGSDPFGRERSAIWMKLLGTKAVFGHERA
jgi:hypothetical protein